MQKITLVSKEKVDVEKLIDIEVVSDFGTYRKVVPTRFGVLTILIYEEYYFRIGSDLSVTIISDVKDSGTTVEIIAAGGKDLMQGVSLGAEKKALKGFTDVLIKEGFEVKEN